MNHLMNAILLASDVATDGASELTAGQQILQLLPTIGTFVLIIAVFYFFMIRPQKKQQKETEQMRSSIQEGGHHHRRDRRHRPSDQGQR